MELTQATSCDVPEQWYALQLGPQLPLFVDSPKARMTVVVVGRRRS
jgi:hypothetical protein